MLLLPITGEMVPICWLCWRAVDARPQKELRDIRVNYVSLNMGFFVDADGAMTWTLCEDFKRWCWIWIRIS